MNDGFSSGPVRLFHRPELVYRIANAPELSVNGFLSTFMSFGSHESIPLARRISQGVTGVTDCGTFGS
jgi:hypothetical protein